MWRLRFRNIMQKYSYSTFSVIIIVPTLALLIFFLLLSYRQTEDLIKKSSDNEAHILASQLDATLRRIQAASNLVAENIIPEALSQPHTPGQVLRINRRLNALGKNFPETLGHLFFDADGQLIFSSDPAIENISIADRSYFQKIIEKPQKGLFFSETFQAKTGQTLTMVAYCAVFGDTGEFRGIIATPIDLRFFESLFAKMDVGSQGMVSIRRSDTSKLVVRWPEIPSGLNKEARDIPPQQQIEAGISGGVIRYTGRTDGVDRIFAFQCIPNFPFYVLVGRAVSEQFAGWYKVATITSALTFVGLLIIGIVLFQLKKGEQRLRLSEVRYLGIVDSQHDAVCRWSPDTTLTFVNTKYSELYDVAGSGLIGKRWVEFIPENERKAILDMYSSPEAWSKSHSIERRIQLHDGTVRFVHWVNIPVLNEKGQWIEFQSIGRDITEIKQVAASLRTSQERYQSFIRQSHEAVYCIEFDHPIDITLPVEEQITLIYANAYIGECNQAMAAMHGALSPDNLTGQRLREVHGSRNILEHQEIFRKFIESGYHVYNFLAKEALADGSILYFQGNKTGMVENGKLVRIWATQLDITEQRKAERALTESQKLLGTVLNAIPVRVFWKDSNLRYLGCNTAFAQDAGFTGEKDLVGKDDYAMVWHDQAELYRADDVDVIENGKTKLLYEESQTTPSGEQIYLLTSKLPLRSTDGSIIGVLGTYLDITQQKRAEEETRILQNQLTQSQKMEAIGTLAGGIAHDFNNILGAITGYTEIVNDYLPPGSIATEYLSKVLQASQRAASLVKQILAFSRQANIERIPLQPSLIVKEVIKLLRPSLPSTITFKLAIDPATSLILADPTQVHQILMNFCTNAFHAMEKTGGTLEIILKNTELSKVDLQRNPEIQPGLFVLLSVGDTGSGIGPEIRDKIFNPFFTTKEVGKGTGMGLSIVHGIVTSYGGFITCESELGQGTVFQVYFPAIEEAIEPENNAVMVAPSGTERLLLVDDEEMLADLGKTVLERLGYNVTMFTSSLVAFSVFRNQPERFDAVITDQTMPGMTGTELSRQILQIRPDIPIILCTGYSSLVNKEQAKAEGVKGFIDKPMTQQAIATLLRKVLDESRVEG